MKLMKERRMSKIIINNKQISEKNIMALYKKIFRPTYGSETWTMNQRSISKLQAAEMRYLRKVEDATRFDKKIHKY